MATCKNCVHHSACTSDWHKLKNVEPICKHFKSKVNMVKVVRCANCIHRKKDVFRAVDNLVYWQCEKHNIEILLTDFCSYGERDKTI